MIADDINSNNANRTVAFALGGAGGLTWAAPARTLTLTGINTYTGPTTIAAGCTVVAGSTQIFGPNSAVTNAGTLNITGFNNSVGSYEGAGATTLGAATLTVGSLNAATTYSGIASGTGGITKVGTAAQTFTGVSTYTGLTTVTAGTLTFGTGTAGQFTPAANAINIAAGASCTYNTTSTITHSGNIIPTGTGFFRATGTGDIALTGNNSTATGGFYSTGGTVRFLAAQNTSAASTYLTNAPGRFILATAGVTYNFGGLTGTGTVAPATGLANTLSVGAANVTQQFTGIISGAISLIKVGANGQILSGANTFTGSVTVNAGDMQSSSATALGNGGACAVNTGCTLTFTVNHTGTKTVTVNAGGTVNKGGFGHGGITFINNGGVINA